MNNPSPEIGSARGETLRIRVMDAAEDLLRDGRSGFSMRDLAARAGVSFATPFNQFGSKAALMHALSARRIEAMEDRFRAAAIPASAAARIMLAIDIAVGVMLEAPDVNRSIMQWLGSAGQSGGNVWARSTALWAMALAEGDGLAPDPQPQHDAWHHLPAHLAFAFRGVLSFWTAGELTDDALGHHARSVAAALLQACAR